MADVDIEALGLLDGLEGEARKERVQLIAWLLDRGFSIDHIRASVAAPLMLPAYRVLGDDGQLVSARELQFDRGRTGATSASATRRRLAVYRRS